MTTNIQEWHCGCLNFIEKMHYMKNMLKYLQGTMLHINILKTHIFLLLAKCLLACFETHTNLFLLPTKKAIKGKTATFGSFANPRTQKCLYPVHHRCFHQIHHHHKYQQQGS